MKLNYQQFYRIYGTRRPFSLINPTLIDLKELPLDSMVHYLTYNDTDINVDTTKPYLQNKKLTYVDFVDRLVPKYSNPQFKNIPMFPLVKDWLHDHRDYRYIKDAYKTIIDSRTMVVNNYSYLRKLYRYPNAIMSAYNGMMNLQATMWSKINEICSGSARHHFVFLDIPEVLPSFSLLNMYSVKTTPAMLKVFDTPDKIMMLELWKWLGKDTHDSSVLSELKSIHYGKVNLVITNAQQRSIIINLGYLHSWILGSENLTEFTSVQQFNTQQLQKIFLKGFINAHSLDITPVSTSEVNDIDTVGAPDEIDELDREELEDLSNDIKRSTDTVTSPIDDIPTTELKDIDDLGETDYLKEIDDDIQTLELITARQMQQRGISVSGDDVVEHDVTVPELSYQDIHDKVFKEKPFTESLVEQLDAYADFGILPASDYKKLLKDVEGFQKLPDPYKSRMPITDAARIEPKDLEINEYKRDIQASNLVIDKSMTKSSLLSYNEDYIKHVMRKDILSMVSSVQRAGVIIKNYHIENVNSVLGEYEYHTLELKPIDGSPSTIRFRIPKVDEEGKFVVSGNTYKLRSQRVDQNFKVNVL